MANSEDELEQIEDDIDVTPSKINKKKVLFFLLPLLVIVSVIVSIFTIFNRTSTEETKNYSVVKKTENNSALIFYDLPEVEVLLRDKLSGDNRLRMKLSIELENEADIPTIEAMISRLTDVIISHTIELTPGEVRGIEGLYWLKEEILYRMNLVTNPVKITNLNFKSFEFERVIRED